MAMRIVLLTWSRPSEGMENSSHIYMKGRKEEAKLNGRLNYINKWLRRR